MPNIERWRHSWREMGVVADDDLYHQVVARYREPHRRYHNIQHLDECFAKFDEIRSAAEHPAEIELALWFHDAVYDVKGRDNEEQSAEWARNRLLVAGLSDDSAKRVHSLIMATRHGHPPDGLDEQILADVDLSILAAPAERFDEYERQVREEYDWVPITVFRQERRAILERFLARERIFSTFRFHEAYEERARANLGRSIHQLTD